VGKGWLPVLKTLEPAHARRVPLSKGHMSQPGTPLTIHEDFETIERYVAATFTRYERVLVTMIPTLQEPRVVHLNLALARLRFLVETLGGLAVGIAIGAVARSVRRGFGEEVRDRISALLDQIVRGDAPAMAMSEFLLPARFLRDPGRPMLDALGTLLLARLRRLQPETCTHVSSIHAEIMRVVPARLPLFAAVLKLLMADDVSALTFSDQLALGWQHYTAAVSDRPRARLPEADAKEGEGPWRAWTTRLGGRVSPIAPTRDEIMEEGFLLQII